MPYSQLEHYVNIAQSFDSVEDVSGWLINLGKSHTIKDTVALRSRENYITGCQNALWISGSCYNELWEFDIDSDIYYVKGIGKIVTDTMSQLSKSEIVKISYHDFKPFAQLLPVQRQKGIQQIINRIHRIVESS